MPLKTGTPVAAGTLAATCISTSATFRMSETAGTEDKQGRSIFSDAINHISNSWDDSNCTVAGSSRNQETSSSRIKKMGKGRDYSSFRDNKNITDVNSSKDACNSRVASNITGREQ
jgi:hypothetical protein